MVDKRDFEHILKNFMPEAKLREVWQMEGGVSTLVWALEIEKANGEVEKLILRQEANTASSETEFRLLKRLHELGLPVPKVHYLDMSASILSKPFLVMDFVDGKADFAPENLPSLLEQMLMTLVKIHSISLKEHDFSFLPLYRERVLRRLERPSQSALESRIYEVLKPFFSRESRNKATFLHGDYWPGNLLWNEGKLLAVIDWEDAALGDPLAELAIVRLELFWGHGTEAMNQFTENYRAKMPEVDFADLAYWDLFAALRPMNDMSHWGLEAERLARMQKELARFAEEAFKKLA